MRAVEAERVDLLRDRLRSWRGHIVSPEAVATIGETLPQEGKRFRFFLRTVVMVISVLSGLLLFGFLYTVQIPSSQLVSGLICIGASIWARRVLGWRHTGAEEGWILAGLSLIVFALPDAVIGNEAFWFWLAAASLIAAITVRAPLFQGFAALLLFVGVYSVSSETVAVWTALTGCVAAAIVRQMKRRSPFVELGLAWTQVAFAASAVFLIPDHFPLIGLGAAVVILALGIRHRDSITLWTSLGFVAITAFEAGRRIPLAEEWKLMLGGGLVLTFIIVLERILTRPRAGWTSRAIGSSEGDLLELAGTVALASPGPGPTHQGGGEFGGGGATERY